MPALALVAAGCGGNGGSTPTARDRAADASARRFAVSVQAQLRRGQFERAWRSLHPAQKRFVSAQRLTSCYPRNVYPRTVTFRATEVQQVRWHVPGTAGLSDADAVTVTATSRGRTVDVFEQHIVRSGGTWRWMLSRVFFDRARRGAC